MRTMDEHAGKQVIRMARATCNAFVQALHVEVHACLYPVDASSACVGSMQHSLCRDLLTSSRRCTRLTGAVILRQIPALAMFMVVAADMEVSQAVGSVWVN